MYMSRLAAEKEFAFMKVGRVPWTQDSRKRLSMITASPFLSQSINVGIVWLCR